MAENQARFGEVTGTVSVLTQGASERIEARVGLPIESGDTIETGEDGQAEIILSDNVVWFLESNGEFVMGHLEEHEGELSIRSGALNGNVDSRRTSRAQKWNFLTPTAVCAVRGTEFSIEVSPEKTTRLAVFQGTVDLSPAETAEGPQPAVRLAAGQEAMVARGKALERLSQLSPAMQARRQRLGTLRRRFGVLQGIWSPHTPAVRKDLRQKFVKPVAPKRAIPKPGRRRRPARPDLNQPLN